MSVTGLVTSVSNFYQQIQGELTAAGWLCYGLNLIWGRVRRQWVFRDKATLATELSLATRDAELSRREKEDAQREAGMALRRAEVAEETVQALNESIQNLREALEGKIDLLSGEVQALQHKTIVQTQFLRVLMACIKNGSPMPDVPAELRDDVQTP